MRAPSSTLFDQTALTDRAERLVKAARAAGADSADAVAVRGMSLSIEVRDGAIEESERAEGDDLGLRVLVGKRQAVVSTNDTASDGSAALAERAVAMARAAPEDKYAGLADEALLVHDVPDLDLIDPDLPSVAQLETMARAAEQAGLAVKGVAKSGGASASAGIGVHTRCVRDPKLVEAGPAVVLDTRGVLAEAGRKGLRECVALAAIAAVELPAHDDGVTRSTWTGAPSPLAFGVLREAAPITRRPRTPPTPARPCFVLSSPLGRARQALSRPTMTASRGVGGPGHDPAHSRGVPGRRRDDVGRTGAREHRGVHHVEKLHVVGTKADRVLEST